jgi:heat shock protein HslJ
MNKLLLLILPCLVFVTSCNPKPKGGNIENTFWVLKSLRKGRKVSTINPDTKITAFFKSGNISGESVCNNYSCKIETEGPMLSVLDISSTEKGCDGLDLENNYLGLLMKATGYTASDGQLIVYSENGRLDFRKMSESEATDYQLKLKSERLEEFFTALPSDSILHLYPILKIDNPGTYPYAGILIEPSFYNVFDEKMKEVWNSSGGDVFAVGKYGDLYICRIPGRYVSSDLALFRRNGHILQHQATVAWAWCDEGWCNQQDAWIISVNGDTMPDIVQHFEYKDDKGKIQEERLELLLQTATGDFVPNNDLRLNRTIFKLAKI